MYRSAVIDDSAIIRKMLKQRLPSEGYECVSAANAKAGWNLCRDKKPDVILLDVNLPDGNGIEICRKFKDDEQLRHIPILIMTGEATDIKNRVAGLEAGADDYVLTPLNWKELMARLKGIVVKGARPSRG